MQAQGCSAHYQILDAFVIKAAADLQEAFVQHDSLLPRIRVEVASSRSVLGDHAVRELAADSPESEMPILS